MKQNLYDWCIESNMKHLLEEWNTVKNGNLTPKDVAVQSNKKVSWQCKKGHEWEAVIGSRTKGSGCPYCAGQKVIKGLNDLATLNPEIAEQWHPTRNGKLTANDVMPGSHKKIWWICIEGHPWITAVYNRSRGRNCPYCTGKKVWSGYNDLATVDFELSKQWHPTKNGKLTAKDVTPHSNKKIWWQCDYGHEWQAFVYSRTNGSNCPVCANQMLLSGFNDLATICPELGKQWHPTKNGELKANDVMPGSHKKVWWKCLEYGHEWQATVYSRFYGNGCPKCSAVIKTSFAEQAIYYYISLQNKTVINRYQYKGKYEIDIYIPKNDESMAIGIEYRNIYHHKNRKAQDEKKDNTLKADSNKLKYFVINEVEKEQNENIFVNNDTIFYPVLNNYKNLDDLIRIIFKLINYPVPDYLNSFEDRFTIWNQYIFECKKNSIEVTHPQITKEWHPVKNKELLPNMFSAGSHKVMWWKCKKNHEWNASIANRTGGKGCPICSNKIVLKGFNDLATTSPAIADQWHSTRNGKLTPFDVTSGSGKKVWWQCKKECHEWEAVIYSRKKTHALYAQIKLLKSYNDLATTCSNLAAEWHSTKK